MSEVFIPGSSPHTRDKSIRGYRATLKSRIIPAYAGQILHSQSILTALKDHPRIRGTNLSWESFFGSQSGSSPHTRDKFINAFRLQGYCRIIPAYAGQMIGSFICSPHRQDHPRIRGTNAIVTSVSPLTMGSSPHTRDK